MTGEVLRYAAFTDGGRGGKPAGVVLDAKSLKEGDSIFHVRDAFPPGGVVEDPATGAAAAFGGYLERSEWLPGPRS